MKEEQQSPIDCPDFELDRIGYRIKDIETTRHSILKYVTGHYGFSRVLSKLKYMLDDGIADESHRSRIETDIIYVKNLCEYVNVDDFEQIPVNKFEAEFNKLEADLKLAMDQFVQSDVEDSDGWE